MPDVCKEFIRSRVPYGHILLNKQTVLSGLQKIRNTQVNPRYRFYYCKAKQDYKTNLMFLSAVWRMSAGAEGGADAPKEVWPSQSRPLSHDRVTLVVDGTRFVVDPAVFSAYPDTVLGRY